MAEFTQEQLDALIAEKVAKAKEGLFTEEDLTKKVTAEVDRRVESGIQTGLATQKTKWEQEFAERAKLSAEELAKKQLEEQTTALTTREKEIAKKANLIDAKDLLSNAGIPKSQYEKVLGILVSEDAEATQANVQNFINVFNETKAEIENKVKEELSKVKPPKSGGSETVTKADFDKMGYAEKLDFKKNYPELYKEFMK